MTHSVASKLLNKILDNDRHEYVYFGETYPITTDDLLNPIAAGTFGIHVAHDWHGDVYLVTKDEATEYVLDVNGKGY